MAFSQIPNFFTGAAADSNGSSGNQSAGLDSITLGQLRSLVGTGPKPKQSWFDFKYDDEDTVMNEIEEFYSYVEMPQAAENLRAWEGSFPREWTKATLAERKSHVEILLESLEHRNAEIRFTNARRLFYILQGTFAETVSPEHQLHWIFENCKVVRSANGVSSVVEAIKIASHKHDLLCSLTDQDATQLGISAADKADLLEEIITEISVYFGMLYFLVEIFKGHDDFADELMSLDPPMPVYLFHLVAGLRDKSTKGYPIKKLLLVLWKTLLAVWGGVREHTRVKKVARELEGLPPVQEDDILKSTPMDIEAFRQETSVKYPTFVPPPPPPPPEDVFTQKPGVAKFTSKLAEAHSPIPVRHHYHHDEESETNSVPQQQGSINPFIQQQNMNNAPFQPGPQPATPAPSPPPSPKPKKQQYQTDQNRPFLFPFSKSNPRQVPFAIEEADRLYNNHIHVSLALTQMWKTREDCMISESGLDHLPGSEGEYNFSTFNAKAKMDPENTELLPDVELLERRMAEVVKITTEAESPSEERKAKERKEDLMRLKRVEQIYSAVLPVLSGWVLVLLKLLLATVSANTGGIQQQSSTASGFTPDFVVQEQPPQPPPTLDEIDVTRHREITSKAVSAILLLVLKWFKVSHVMKFHQLGQHLLDTNCLLLILKMFGLQEVSNSVVSKADSPENNFFQYCMRFSKNPQATRSEDHQLRPARQTVVKTTILPNHQKHEEEVEYIMEYSWRNFFSAINFARIMHKLSKGRSHRIGMLVQYKSSAVLKRVLRVNHPMLQLHILKLIKSQVPFCGRKWRQSNMKVITSIYLNCRPDLRDEWLTGIEVEDPADAQAQEQALRHLVKFYNMQRYGPAAAANQHAMHRRSGSISHNIEGLHPGPELSALIRPVGTPNIAEVDVFPPSRSQAPDPSIFLPYIAEDIAFEEEYEDYLSDLGWTEEQTGEGQNAGGGTSAWHRLPELVSEMTQGISDSESIVSIGELGDDARLDPSRDERDVTDENLNNWEHLSPRTMAALPRSPHGRRSSSGSGLRPVMPFGLDDGSAIDLDGDEDASEPGPMPREQNGPFGTGAGVDEVEYAYGV